MFVIESCQKIEYNALFMMIFIPVSNFGDQPLLTYYIVQIRHRTIWIKIGVVEIKPMATQVAAKIIGIVAATPPKRGVQRRQAAGCRCGWRQATYDARRKPTVNGASNGDLISSNSIWCLSVCFCFCLCTLHRVPKLLSGLTRHCDDFALNDLKLRCHH